MSLRISKEFLTIRDINEIKSDCFVQGVENDYGPANTLRAYGETPMALYLPFAYAKNKFKRSPNKDLDFPKTCYTFYSDEFGYRTDGGRDQEQVFNEALGLICKHRSVLLSLFCAYGKTFLAIKLAQKLRFKTAVLVHRGVLFDQWIESIHKFTSGTVQRVDTDGILDAEVDFYIFNTAFVHRRWDKSSKSWQLKKLGIYKNIGLLIVDEAHIACATEMSRALLYFNPRVTIALTATPIRRDGMDKTLELYFGMYNTTRIIRVAKNPFTVYRLPTGIKPEFTLNKFGKKDWSSVIQYLTEDIERNKIIIDLVKKFDNFNILILTKRKNHCKLLSANLTKIDITNTVMIGSQKEYDITARVLISTYSKLGIGFDSARLNMLIIACSVTEIEQYAGRLRDEKDKQRIIIDLVDNDSSCKKHWQDRRKWYLSRNGQIKNYYSVFPKECVEVITEQEQLAPKRLSRRI